MDRKTATLSLTFDFPADADKQKIFDTITGRTAELIRWHELYKYVSISDSEPEKEPEAEKKQGHALWQKNDDGEWSAKLHGFGIELRVRPDPDLGSAAEVWTGQFFPGERYTSCLHLMAAWKSSAPPDSDEAKINAFRAFRSWYGSVMTLFGMSPDEKEWWNNESID